MRASRRILFGLFCALVALLTVAGCTTPGSGSNGGDSPESPPVSSAQITVAHSDGTPINPVDPIVVTVQGGTLTDVQVTNPEGAAVPGVLTPDKVSWKTNEPLGYDRAYTVVATATDSDGVTATATETVTTLEPSNQTKVYFENTGGNAINPDATYGVGMVVAAHFDEPIVDRAAAQRTLTVTTTPNVEGSWNWVNDTTAHWRPKEYYPAGTQVSISAKLYGVDVGGGMYGQEDESIAFNIGDSHVSIADDNTHMVTVYENGQQVRTMPTSMGMGGTQEVGGQTFTFWTQPGVYTVLGTENPVVMDSSTYGLPINSRLGYKEVINWATRISNDGIYLHALDSTVWAQGNTNTSHGCLNLSTANAEWFFNFSQPGDVVEVKNTGGTPLQIWQNGDWTVSWADWVAGSAL
ncbi:L,D-transpeptidase [Tomitella biformata]|uniref:L,D-transpeptidase n=1 Tax=Tomitella biformata TaxID=630403 RepID=UPI000462FFFC|nr:Ig-like domain-containing protein [Tomitella biformata]